MATRPRTLHKEPFLLSLCIHTAATLADVFTSPTVTTSTRIIYSRYKQYSQNCTNNNYLFKLSPTLRRVERQTSSPSKKLTTRKFAVHFVGELVRVIVSLHGATLNCVLLATTRDPLVVILALETGFVWHDQQSWLMWNPLGASQSFQLRESKRAPCFRSSLLKYMRRCQRYAANLRDNIIKSLLAKDYAEPLTLKRFVVPSTKNQKQNCGSSTSRRRSLNFMCSSWYRPIATVIIHSYAGSWRPHRSKCVSRMPQEMFPLNKIKLENHSAQRFL